VNTQLRERITRDIAREVHPVARAFGERLAVERGAVAALFYGSNLRTGVLAGVLDFYLLTPGPPERGLWPQVSYHEWSLEGTQLRAKVAMMSLTRFAQAASGELLDTTIWARFVQPSALVWCANESAAIAVGEAIRSACICAARLAVALGPKTGLQDQYWSALFRETYRAEFRVEKPGREKSIIELNFEHFRCLLSDTLPDAGIGFASGDRGDAITPLMPESQRNRVLRWWARRRRLGKPLNLLRLIRAAWTFDGAARYAAWKIERHTGVAVALTPWRERHPVLAAPGVMWSVWQARRKLN
jgi:hypothetical protein